MEKQHQLSQHNVTDESYMIFFHKSVDPMLIIEDGHFVECNKAAMSMLQYDDKEEMMNLHPSQLSPEYQPDGQKSFDKAAEILGIVQQTGGHIFEWDHLRKTGEIIPVEVSLTAVTSGGKNIVHTVWRDISYRRKAREENDLLKEQLYRSQKMEAIGLMAGGVAHDLNNILSGIVSYPDLLLVQIKDNEDAKEIITEIPDSGRRAADVVADLLVVARGITTERVTVNLNDLVTEYLVSPEGKATSANYPLVETKTCLSPDLLNFPCSIIHIKKCLMNLIINAAESIQREGTVTISTHNEYIEKPRVDGEHQQEGEFTVLTVSDNGTGISPEDIDHIFEPFYTKKVLGKSGTGLGLAIVWNTIKDHHGWINVRSSDAGSAFEIFFPAVRSAKVSNPKDSEVENLSGHGEKILVVDDEKLQRDIASNILRTLGYSVTAVASGEEAVTYLENNVADLILLDMIMGLGMNGRETYEAILKMHPNQRAIISSGYSENSEVEKAQKLGAGEFIKKPYLLRTIGLAIKQALAV